MKISDKGLELIKFFEGLRLEAYFCPAGLETIGYGHVLKKGDPKKITESEANQILKKDLEYFETEVKNMLKVQVSQNQFDALVSFAFNLGPASLKTSTLLNKLNTKQPLECIVEFLKWTLIGKERSFGLLKRRIIEASMFMGIPYNLS